jgi:hypothetical protein
MSGFSKAETGILRGSKQIDIDDFDLMSDGVIVREAFAPRLYQMLRDE